MRTSIISKMEKSISKVFFISFLTIMFVSIIKVKGQEKIYLPYIETINMHKDYQLSTTRLLKLYLEANNKTEVILSISDSVNNIESKDKAFENAKLLNINLVLIGEFNRVGEVAVISLSLYNISSNEKIWNTIQKTASPDDIDPVIQNIAQNINNRDTEKSLSDIYSVSNYESKELNKMNANTFYGIEIGGGTSFLNLENGSPAGFGVVYSGDMRNVIFDIKASLYFSDLNLSVLSIHINYPFLKKAESPYLGAGLGYGMSSLNNKVNINEFGYIDRVRGNGLTLFAGGGYLFNRTSNINLRVNANLFTCAYKINNMYPSGIIASVMILF